MNPFITSTPLFDVVRRELRIRWSQSQRLHLR